MYYNVIHKEVLCMSNISVRLNEQEETLFKTYAEFMDETLSTLFKKALLEKIEYKQDPVTYSVAEMRAKYGL